MKKNQTLEQASKAKISKLLGQLPSLTPPELHIIKAAIEQLLNTQPEENSPTQDLFYALTQVTGSGMFYAQFKKTVSHRTWRLNAPPVVLFIDRCWPNITQNQRLSLMKFMFELLADDMRGRKIPVTLGLMINHTTRLPEVLKTQFPDYIESGLAHLIIAAMKRRKK